MTVALEAAGLAGQIILDRFDTSLDIRFKGRADIVTDVDLAAEKAVLELLRDEFPYFGVLAEESAPIDSNSGYTWVVDPLDGTRNYAKGIPHFCTVVALAKGSDIIVGVTYDPVRQEYFVAEAGKGAFLNHTPINVTGTEDVSDAGICFDMGYVDEKAGLALDMLRNLWPGVQSLRLMGSAALGIAYAAAGRVDMYFHHALSPWDIASGLLLVREAGGIVVDRQGNTANLHTPSIIAANQTLVSNFLKAIEGDPWRDG
ncbi:MAG: hypothetical protein BZY88_12205 [SAR202 cluster bacterium Io17-Chloro-G9]|nr:MAG: hypothetical protein BZY88_12205 [SAR202 cluster bacterium Io17-Chloro-G9]